MKYVPWSEEFAERELTKRFLFAKEARLPQERTWIECERGMYSTDGGDPKFHGSSTSTSETGGNVIFLGTNRINHHVRFVHSQMATNPPMVLPRPTSNDPEDSRKANIADKLAHYALRQYSLQNITDNVSLLTIIYGTGIGKPIWNPALGEILTFDENTGEVTMSGDFDYSAVSPWDIYPDPDAKTWGGNNGIKWLFEETNMDYTEACYQWPDKIEILQAFRIQEQKADSSTNNLRSSSYFENSKYDIVRILQYWERGLPSNGMIGRYGWCCTNGESIKLLEPLEANPHSFSAKEGLPGIAQIPHIIFTDQDVPGTYWGKSNIEFAVKHQDARNMLDTAQLDILKAHGVARLVVFGGSEFNKTDSITNSPLDIVVVDGQQKPDFISPVPMPQGMISLTDALKKGEDEIFSINEAMTGQVNRETAGTTMQYATQNGNSIRYRLFIKYTGYVESLFKSFFNIVKKNWTTARTIQVTGKEKAYEAIDIKGTDVDRGFDIVAEYGTSFSLDPIQRRQEIMTMAPMLKEAGIGIRAQLRMMKMSALDTIYDLNDLGKSRQDEIFRKMIETGEYVAPGDWQEHPPMMEYAQSYVMTAEFTYLAKDKQELIIRHKKEREQMAGTQAAAASGTLPGAPGAEGEAPVGPPAAPSEPPPGNLMDLLTRG